MFPDLVVPVPVPAAEIIDAFHRLYYHTEAWKQYTFLGYPIRQNPLDLHLYQELIFKVRPRFVLQTGVAFGGSILFFATLLDLCGAPQDVIVVGIDIELWPSARTLCHPRIRLIEGNSTDPETLRLVKSTLPDQQGFVVLDSDHARDHVAIEMQMYWELVGVNSYLVVEDTNINGHPVYPQFGPGPFEAVGAFLQDHPSFIADEEIWRKNLFSHHQHGWLKRVK